MHAAVPVQRLSARARVPFFAHLRQLGPGDRRLRFGAPLTDVERIDFAYDRIFAVLGDVLDVVGAAHFALPPPTPLSLPSEWLADRVATCGFALKSGVETWRRIAVVMAANGRR
ncbi:MAG: hypothetical protein ABI593_04965 [Betaproteobacteria bacterium]